MNDVKEYVSSEGVSNVMSTGYKINMKISGNSLSLQQMGVQAIDMKGMVSIKEDNKMEFGMTIQMPATGSSPATYMETYLRGNEAFARTSADGKYTKTTVDLNDVTDDIQNTISEYTQLADVSSFINQYLEIFGTLEGQGLKIKKTAEGGDVRFKMTCKDASGSLAFTIAYKNKEISVFDLDYRVNYQGLNVSIIIQFEKLEGEVEFPADLDTNVEVEPVIPPEGEEEPVAA